MSNLPERLSAGLRTTSQDAELVFRVMLPPLGFTSVAVDRVDPGMLLSCSQENEN